MADGSSAGEGNNVLTLAGGVSRGPLPEIVHIKVAAFLPGFVVLGQQGSDQT